ncbi:hypothetical protein [Leptolyngbya sp. NIES-2104]|uniref:hypothetical protein n=1 Tax=Leptolyngbya sp. NIES-2104 TaxID=1552121 RepID=UPI0012E3374D|nr:hypothetical protein [Leptolyngbya sp. NIES-2104]
MMNFSMLRDYLLFIQEVRRPAPRSLQDCLSICSCAPSEDECPELEACSAWYKRSHKHK